MRRFSRYGAKRSTGFCRARALVLPVCRERLRRRMRGQAGYGRDTQGFSNLLICIPARRLRFTMCRQFSYDAFSLPLMQNGGSSDERLA